MNFTKMFNIFAMFCLIYTLSTGISYAQLVPVDYNNYAHVETDLTMHRVLKTTKGVNQWVHIKQPTPIENQKIIRMNRDTLYSIAVVDVRKGASITIPKADKRYISIAVINTDGYTNMVKIGGGKYDLNKDNVGTDYALIIMRIFVDSNSTEDIKAANKLQDEYKIEAKSSIALPVTSWNMNNYNEVYKSLLSLFKVAKSAHDMFGPKDEVDSVYFLIGSAGGFGGLPSKNAVYYNYNAPKDKANAYQMVLKDVPVNAFWSFTVYNKDGYLFESEHGVSNINSSTAKANTDGSYTLYFGQCQEYKENCLGIEEGWNGILRLYEPKDNVNSWELPSITPITK